MSSEEGTKSNNEQMVTQQWLTEADMEINFKQSSKRGLLVLFQWWRFKCECGPHYVGIELCCCTTMGRMKETSFSSFYKPTPFAAFFRCCCHVDRLPLQLLLFSSNIEVNNVPTSRGLRWGPGVHTHWACWWSFPRIRSSCSTSWCRSSHVTDWTGSRKRSKRVNQMIVRIVNQMRPHQVIVMGVAFTWLTVCSSRMQLWTQNYLFVFQAMASGHHSVDRISIPNRRPTLTNKRPPSEQRSQLGLLLQQQQRSPHCWLTWGSMRAKGGTSA